MLQTMQREQVIRVHLQGSAACLLGLIESAPEEGDPARLRTGHQVEWVEFVCAPDLRHSSIVSAQNLVQDSVVQMRVRIAGIQFDLTLESLLGTRQVPIVQKPDNTPRELGFTPSPIEVQRPFRRN